MSIPFLIAAIVFGFIMAAGRKAWVTQSYETHRKFGYRASRRTAEWTYLFGGLGISLIASIVLVQEFIQR
jgi:hypothetical protein